jgi:polysaccharide export outer membrane protein
MSSHTIRNFVFTLIACALLPGCAGSGSSSTYAPAPASTANNPAMTPIRDENMRVGDKITIRLDGVPDGGYFVEVQIPDSGQVSVNLLTQTFQAAGRTPAQLAADIVQAYKTQKIYTNPQVAVLEEETRYINVGGDVRGPTNVVWRSDSTLMSTINACGGFTEYANRRSVRIVRGSQVIYVDCVKAAAVPGADPPVYPGDQIYVPRTIL